MTDRTTNLILKAQVDQSAADSGVRALQQLQANADEARVAFTNIFKGVSNAADDLHQIDASADSVRNVSDSWDATAKSIQGADDKLKQYIADGKAALEQQRLSPTDADFGGTDESGGGGLGSIGGLRRTGGALRQLGLTQIGHDVTLLGDLQQVSKEFGVIGEALKGLPGLLGNAAEEGVALGGGLGGILAVAGPLVAAVGAIAIAWKVLISDALEPANKALEEARISVDAYYAAIGKGTTDSIQKQITDLEAQKKAVDEKVATITNSLAGGFAGAQEQFGDFGARLITAADSAGAFGGGVQGVEKDLDAAKKQSEDFQGKLDGLRRSLGASTVAANDAAAAEKTLQDARAKSADAAIAQAVADEQLKQTGTSKGVEAQINDIDAERAAIEQQLAINAGLSKDKVQELAKRLHDLSDRESDLTYNILPAIKAREAEDQAAKDATKAFDEFTKSMNELGKVTAEIAKLEADRAKQVAQEQADDARNAQRAAVEKDYQTRIDAAKRAEAEQAERDKVGQADADALTKFNDDKAKIIANEFDGELKAYQNYIDAEKRQTDQANRQRLQTLESAQNDLKNLAAAGDVAGFVQRSNQAKLDLKHQAENADGAQKQLYDNYEKQVQAARDAEIKQLNDLQVTFDREKAVRDTAAADRIAQIENSGKEANTRSAQLEQELNNIREQWRRDDLKRQRDLEEQNYEDRLQVQQDKQREILAQTGNFFDQWINDIAKQAAAVLQAAQQATSSDTMTPADVQAAQTASDYLNSIDSGDQTFATGLDYVPRNNYRASLDLGERVLTAQQNRDYSSGGGRRGGDTYQVTVQNTVGDVATKSMLDEYQSETVDGIKQALRQAKGKGSS